MAYKRMGQKIVKRIAKRFDISMDDAKRFYLDRKEAKLEGRVLPFHKWKKRNLNFDDTIDGNDIEEGDFDNFFSRKKRRAIRRKLRKASPRNVLRMAKARVKRDREILRGGLSDLRKRRKLKVRRHKNILKKLANPRFMANPKNALKIRDKVKQMAIGINKSDKRIIRKAQKLQGRPFGRGLFGTRPRPKYRRFDGYSDNSFLNADGTKKTFFQKNKMLIIGGAVIGFLFFTPMGKKLIK